jgi:hypothetical protein
MYHTEPRTYKTICEWYMKFQQSGCLCGAKRTGQPGPLAKNVDCVQAPLSGAHYVTKGGQIEHL